MSPANLLLSEALGTSAALAYPGGSADFGEEDPRVVAALLEYVEAVEAGDAPDRSEFLRRHSELAPAPREQYV